MPHPVLTPNSWRSARSRFSTRLRPLSWRKGTSFKVFTPAESVKLAAEGGADDFIEIVLDSTVNPPRVTGHTSRSRGRRSTSSERPIRHGSGPADLTEEDVLDFLVEEIAAFVER